MKLATPGQSARTGPCGVDCATFVLVCAVGIFVCAGSGQRLFEKKKFGPWRRQLHIFTILRNWHWHGFLNGGNTWNCLCYVCAEIWHKNF